jgi:hypothetical protein
VPPSNAKRDSQGFEDLNAYFDLPDPSAVVLTSANPKPAAVVVASPPRAAAATKATTSSAEKHRAVQEKLEFAKPSSEVEDKPAAMYSGAAYAEMDDYGDDGGAAYDNDGDMHAASGGGDSDEGNAVTSRAVKSKPAPRNAAKSSAAVKAKSAAVAAKSSKGAASRGRAGNAGRPRTVTVPKRTERSEERSDLEDGSLSPGGPG